MNGVPSNGLRPLVTKETWQAGVWQQDPHRRHTHVQYRYGFTTSTRHGHRGWDVDYMHVKKCNCLHSADWVAAIRRN